ncbi:MAG: hypothetical protein GY906_29370 [bacterium]|nr:hypothetical protein [bacterium]
MARIETNNLLAIDVAAELRLIGAAQLQGPWQLPTELVRFALKRGAQRVEVTLQGSKFQVADDGCPIGSGSLKALVATLESSVASAERQRALEELETAGGVPLLWAATLAPHRLVVNSGGDDSRDSLIIRAGRTTLSKSDSHDGACWAVRISGSMPRREVERAVDAVVERCRFAEAKIVVNGGKVARGFPGGLYRMRFADPVEGVVALTRTADTSRLWLLSNGVVSTRATLPGYPPFEAAVELGEIGGGETSPSELRAAVGPYLQQIVDRAMDMMVRLSRRLPELEEPARSRLIAVLLEAASRNVWRGQIRKLGLLRALDPGGGAPRWLSLEELQSWERGSIPVVSSADELEGSVTGGSPVLALPVSLRGRVADLTGKRLVAVVPIRRSEGIFVRASRVVGRLRFAAGRVVASRGIGKRIADSMLDGWERAGLKLLREQILGATGGRLSRVYLCEGSGLPVIRGSAGLIPRKGQAIKALKKAHQGDKGALYPIMLVLLEGHGEPLEEMRTLWIDGVCKDKISEEGGQACRVDSEDR